MWRGVGGRTARKHDFRPQGFDLMPPILAYCASPVGRAGCADPVREAGNPMPDLGATSHPVGPVLVRDNIDQRLLRAG